MICIFMIFGEGVGVEQRCGMHGCGKCFLYTTCTCLNVKSFFYQIVAKLAYNATEIIRFLKTFKNSGFLKK